MFVILGASGNTGSAAANALLDAGEKVRVIARHADKLAAFTARGAESALGDAGDLAFLTTALTGATGAYVLIPPDYGYADYAGRYAALADIAAQAIEKSGIKRVVFLSSIGGQHTSGTGPIVGLHRAEERLKTVAGIDLLILRPGYFYENSFGSIGMIKHMGINGGAIKADVPVTMTSTHDIGTAAAHALRAGDFTGAGIREVLGPRDYTMHEVTRILGTAIGKPDLAYVTFADDDYRNALVGAGFAPEIAASFVEMAHGINDGRVAATLGQPRTGVVTMEDFAKGFAAAYAAA